MREGDNMRVVKAMFIWCVHDYSTYGMVSGGVTKGY